MKELGEEVLKEVVAVRKAEYRALVLSEAFGWQRRIWLSHWSCKYFTLGSRARYSDGYYD